MNRDQLVKKIRKLARANEISFVLETSKGKGSHYRVIFGGKASTLQHDLNPGRIERFLKQLGIDSADL